MDPKPRHYKRICRNGERKGRETRWVWNIRKWGKEKGGKKIVMEISGGKN